MFHVSASSNNWHWQGRHLMLSEAQDKLRSCLLSIITTDVPAPTEPPYLTSDEETIESGSLYEKIKEIASTIIQSHEMPQTQNLGEEPGEEPCRKALNCLETDCRNADALHKFAKDLQAACPQHEADARLLPLSNDRIGQELYGPRPNEEEYCDASGTEGQAQIKRRPSYPLEDALRKVLETKKSYDETRYNTFKAIVDLKRECEAWERKETEERIRKDQTYLSATAIQVLPPLAVAVTSIFMTRNSIKAGKIIDSLWNLAVGTSGTALIARISSIVSDIYTHADQLNQSIDEKNRKLKELNSEIGQYSSLVPPSQNEADKLLRVLSKIWRAHFHQSAANANPHGVGAVPSAPTPPPGSDSQE